MFELAPGDAHLIFDREWLADFVRGGTYFIFQKQWQKQENLNAPFSKDSN